jgi:hypothetical protein
MMAIWELLHVRGMSSIVQWAAMVANSSVWGFGLSYCFMPYQCASANRDLVSRLAVAELCR